MTGRIEPNVGAQRTSVDEPVQEDSFAELLAMMSGSPLAVLIGPRGEATSRFARAAAIACAESRNRPAGQQSGDVVVLFDQWSGDPLEELCDAIAAALSSASGMTIARSRGDRRTLAQSLARWADRTGSNFVIVLDQYQRNLAAEPLNARNARFSEQLADAINEAAAHVRFLVVVDDESEAALVRLTARLGNVTPGVFRLAPRPATADHSAREEYGTKPASPSGPDAEEPLPGSFSALADDEIDRAATDAIVRRRQRRMLVGRWRNLALGATLVIVTLAGIALIRAWLAPDPGIQLARTLSRESPSVGAAPGTAPALPDSLPSTPAPPTSIPDGSKTVAQPPFIAPVVPAARPTPAPSSAAAQSAGPGAASDPLAVKPPAAVSAPASKRSISESEPAPLIRAITLAPTATAKASGSPSSEPRPQASGTIEARPGPPIPKQTVRAVANPEKGPMLFIHIRNESQRAQARKIASGLAPHSIVISGIRVDQSGPKRADLRYFRAGERDEANYLARALGRLGVSGLGVTRVEGYEAAGAPRHFELWLPPPAR